MPESSAYQAILRPLLTERSAVLKDKYNQYFFAADMRSTKIEIRRAVEELFRVKVASVRTMIMPGKSRRVGRGQGQKPDWKKAVVTLVAGEKIDFAQETA
ncbi:MAG: 50S ribosomal protein L23 [Elusimicrobiota bacterium]